jgi:hypothetical protein
MMWFLIKYGNIVLTTTTGHRFRYHLWLLFLVRPVGYIVNLSDFCAYRLIGKLTAFSQLQEFSQRNQIVDFSTSSAQRSSWYVRLQPWRGCCRPITLGNISSMNVVFIFRCSSSTRNPVYVRCVDSSALVFSLSSHRHSYIGLVFISRFID